MKTRALKSFAIFLLTLLPFTILSQESVSGLLMITVYTDGNSIANNLIIVTEKGQLLEKIELEKWHKNLVERVVEISQVLDKYEKKGYILFDCSKGSIGYVLETTYLYRKE